MVARRVKTYIEERGIKQNWLVAALKANGVKMSDSRLSAILNESRPLSADMWAEICIALHADANIFVRSKTT